MAYEACDPVEGDSYAIDGVAVSDFVTPAWYGDQAAPNVSTQWLATSLVPFTLAADGYGQVRRPGYIPGQTNSAAGSPIRPCDKVNYARDAS